MRRFLVALLLCAACGTHSVREHQRAGAAAGPALNPGAGFGVASEVWVIERAHGTAGEGETGLVTRDAAGKVLPIPLRATDVSGRITLHVASVVVTQKYENPFSEKIEAVYTFPLPDNGAVTDFLMKIGERTIRGIVREREEALQIYLEARRQGYTASLLQQERPNVFTQSIANIEPGKAIDIEIRYFHTLRYADGEYEFHVPVVVGPRFSPPGNPAPLAQPPGLRPGETTAHALSLAVELDAGLDIDRLASPSHSVDVAYEGGRSKARVTLRENDRAPNRDFVLRYRLGGEGVRGSAAVSADGHFTLLLEPPGGLEEGPRLPREMIFVVDCSGSMEGEPLAAAKRLMRRCLKRLDPSDAFQLLRFSDEPQALGRSLLPATPENVRRGLEYVESLESQGGTMMAPAVRTALAFPRGEGRHRIVTFLTDGYIDNEAEVLRTIERERNGARVFACGIGDSVNRYLMESMAARGQGAATYCGSGEDAERATDALFRRLERPALRDVAVDWGSLRAEEVYPNPVPDLLCGQPVVLCGRFSGSVPRSIRVTAKSGGANVQFELPVTVAPAEEPALGRLWARAKIAELTERLAFVEHPDEIVPEIRATALRFGLVSSFTSFVAVDSSRRTEGDHGTTVQVPVPTPQGVRYETTR